MKTEPFGSILAYPSSPHPAFHRALTGSFSYMRNSVCKSHGIPGNFTAKNTAEFRGISRNSVCFSKNSVFRRKSKTHFRGHPSCSARYCFPYNLKWTSGFTKNNYWLAQKERTNKRLSKKITGAGFTR